MCSSSTSILLRVLTHEIEHLLGDDRQVAPAPTATAVLYRHRPPLLATAGADRFITGAGREWLAEHPD